MTKRQFGDFKVEDWYSYISQYTYPTEFLSLTVGQALAIMHAYEIGHKYQNVSNKDGIYTPDDQKIIQNLTQDIQTQMDKHGENSDFFIRLSTRSPKDACLKTPEFKSILQEQIISQGENVNEPLAVIRTLNRLLKIQNAQQAIELLTNSERIYTDLTRTLLFADEKLKKQPEATLPDQMIIIRKFQTVSTPEYEFRTFVLNQGETSKITGITQYFKSCYFGETMLEKENLIQVEKKLFEMCNKVHEAIHTSTDENYGLDLAYDREKNIVYVIELNPFSVQTSPCLFDWQNPTDKKVLHGELPYEFRVLKSPPSRRENRQQLSKDIRAMLDEMFPLPEEPVESVPEEGKKKDCVLQ